MDFKFSNRTQAMRPSIIRELLKQMADPTLISFAGGNPASDAFPVEEIGEISEDLLRNEPVQTLQYNISEGYPPLRLRGADYLNRQWQIIGQEDDLMVTSGSQQVMDFAVRLLCNEGDYIACEDPAFLGALNSYRSYGAHLRGVPMQPDGVDLDALEKVLVEYKPRLFYTIPNFQNPTGYTTSLEKRKAIYELCKKYEVVVLEDNPYGELRFTGEDLPPIKAFDTEGWVIYAASLSKIFAPGLRVAFCVANKALIAKMVLAKQCNDVHTNVWGQRICERFMEHYDMQQHIAQLRHIYGEKANYMMQQLDAKLGNAITYEKPQGGMFLWLNLPAQVNMQAYVQACLDKKLALVPGNAFFVDENAPCNAVRANFSTPDKEDITRGVSIMAEVLAQFNV